MTGNRAAGTLLAGALLFAAAPLSASDFTGLRVALFGVYYFFAAGLALAILFTRSRSRRRIATDLLAAFLVALLFVPSLSDYPNHLIAVPVVGFFGMFDGPLLGLGLPTLLSVGAGTAVLFALLRLTPKLPDSDADGE